MSEEGVAAEGLEAPQPTPLEAKAREQGWKPKEEYEGDKEEWVDAKEFVKRGELFGKIKDLKNELHSRDSRHVEELKTLHNEIFQVRKTALEQAKRDLTSQIRDTDDKDEAVKLSKELVKVEQQLERQPAQNPQAQTIPEVSEWEKKNDWYNKDSDMTFEADTAAAVFLRRNQGPSATAVLEAIDKQMKKLYPEKFGGSKVVTPPSPESGHNKKPAPTGKKTRSDLPEEHRRVMDVFVKRGITTEDKYLKDYFGV